MFPPDDIFIIIIFFLICCWATTWDLGAEIYDNHLKNFRQESGLRSQKPECILFTGVNQGLELPSDHSLKWLFCIAFFWMIVWWNRPGKADEKGLEKNGDRGVNSPGLPCYSFLGLFKIPLLCFPIIFWAQIAFDRMVHVMHWSWKWSPWRGDAGQLQRVIGVFEVGWLFHSLGEGQTGRASTC